jgi:hypothetical protein
MTVRLEDSRTRRCDPTEPRPGTHDAHAERHVGRREFADVPLGAGQRGRRSMIVALAVPPPSQMVSRP